MIDYYKILGIEREASTEEIKKAYRDLAKINHPDKYMNESLEIRKAAEEKIKEYNEAYDILGSEERKKQYDMSFKKIKGSKRMNFGKKAESEIKQKSKNQNSSTGESFLEKIRREKAEKLKNAINKAKGF
ncbi:MAG: J domain-containing protein [Cetobacterium sp.]